MSSFFSAVPNVNCGPAFLLMIKLTFFCKKTLKKSYSQNNHANIMSNYLHLLSFDVNFVYRPEYDDKHGASTCHDDICHNDK